MTCAPIADRSARIFGTVVPVGAANDEAGARLVVVPSEPDALADWVAEAVVDKRAGVLHRADGSAAVAIDASGRIAPWIETLGVDHELVFATWPSHRLRVLAARDRDHAPSDMEGARVLVLGGALRNRLAQAFDGAEVRTCAPEPAAIEAVSSFAPWLVVLEAGSLSTGVAAALVRDERFRAAALLVVGEDHAEADDDPNDFTAAAVELTTDERRVHRALVDGTLLRDRVETLGAARWVKELGTVTRPRVLAFQTKDGVAKLRVEDGRVREASVRPPGAAEDEVLGKDAVRSVLAATEGEAFVGEPEDVERALAASGAPVPKAEPEPELHAEPNRAEVMVAGATEDAEAKDVDADADADADVDMDEDEDEDEDESEVTDTEVDRSDSRACDRGASWDARAGELLGCERAALDRGRRRARRGRGVVVDVRRGARIGGRRSLLDVAGVRGGRSRPRRTGRVG